MHLCTKQVRTRADRKVVGSLTIFKASLLDTHYFDTKKGEKNIKVCRLGNYFVFSRPCFYDFIMARRRLKPMTSYFDHHESQE